MYTCRKQGIEKRGIIFRGLKLISHFKKKKIENRGLGIHKIGALNVYEEYLKTGHFMHRSVRKLNR